MFFFGEKCHSVCLQNEIIIPVIPSFQFVRIFVFTHKKCGYLFSCGALLPLKGKKKAMVLVYVRVVKCKQPHSGEVLQARCGNCHGI